MSSITVRGGKYQVRVRRNGTLAVRTFATEREAAAWAASTEIEIERGTYHVKQAMRVTLRELVERYVEEVTPTKRGAAQEAARFRSMLAKGSPASKMMNCNVADIQPQTVAAWRDARLKKVKPATVQREWAMLAHVVTVARLDWGYADLPNPFASVRKPRVSDARDRRIEAGELDAVCAATESAELASFVRLAVETAARRGELLALEWRDVSLQAATATLRTTKNGEIRTIPLSPAAVALLGSLPRPIGGGRVFSLRPDSVTQAFSRALKRARSEYVRHGGKDPHWLVGIRLHDARHEACSRLAEAGFSTLEVAAVSGHKTLQLLKRYTHLKPEALAQKLAALAEIKASA